MKSLYLLLMGFCFLANTLIAQNITFQYDANGNQIAVKYTGMNPCATATSLDKTLESEVDFRVYPNPSDVEIIIEYKLPSSKTLKNIVIYDNVGKAVTYLNAANKERTHYNISHLNSGIYNCVLQTADNISVSTRFIKL